MVAKNIINLLSGDTPLHLAAENGHLDVATCLIDNGAVMDVRNRLGKTPIARAFKYSHVPILEYFKTLELSVPVVSMKLISGTGVKKHIFPHPRLLTVVQNLTGLTSGEIVEVFDELLVDGGCQLVSRDEV